MVLALIGIIIGIVVVVAVLRARATHKDSNGPMNNN